MNIPLFMKPIAMAAAMVATGTVALADNRVHAPEGELLFDPMHLHNHGSCVVEMPGGGLFACWYRGSGERNADDVAIMGSRLMPGSKTWEAPIVISDTPGFPDTNPCLFVDPAKRLWLFHGTVLNNQWEGSLCRVKRSSNYRKPGAPTWEYSDLVLLKPGPEFAADMQKYLPQVWAPVLKTAPPEIASKLSAQMDTVLTKSKDKLATRMGWMGRAHPTLIKTITGAQRLLLPLYSDGFDISLIAYTDDWGNHWNCSAPVIGQSNVQPSILQRKDGSLIAYFRDNGPPPQRIMQSESMDDGKTWTLAHDIELPDPGAGLEAIKLKSGLWVMLNNDTENGRHSLALTVSEDEGRSWIYKKWLEHDEPNPLHGSYAYPSIIQTRDGMVHVTYSITLKKPDAMSPSPGESIKHLSFSEAWLLDRDGRIALTNGAARK